MDISGRMLTTIILLFLFSSVLVRYFLGPIVGIILYVIIVGYLFLIKQLRENNQSKHKNAILLGLILAFDFIVIGFLMIFVNFPLMFSVIYFILFLGIFYDLSFVEYSLYYKINYKKRKIYWIFTVFFMLLLVSILIVFSSKDLELFIVPIGYIYTRLSRNYYLTKDITKRNGTAWDKVLYSNQS